jgi:hypothetical protein
VNTLKALGQAQLADELIVQTAYEAKHGKLPIKNGTDGRARQRWIEGDEKDLSSPNLTSLSFTTQPCGSPMDYDQAAAEAFRNAQDLPHGSQ